MLKLPKVVLVVLLVGFGFTTNTGFADEAKKGRQSAINCALGFLSKPEASAYIQKLGLIGKKYAQSATEENPVPLRFFDLRYFYSQESFATQNIQGNRVYVAHTLLRGIAGIPRIFDEKGYNPTRYQVPVAAAKVYGVETKPLPRPVAANLRRSLLSVPGFWPIQIMAKLQSKQLDFNFATGFRMDLLVGPSERFFNEFPENANRIIGRHANVLKGAPPMPYDFLAVDPVVITQMIVSILNSSSGREESMKLFPDMKWSADGKVSSSYLNRSLNVAIEKTRNKFKMPNLTVSLAMIHEDKSDRDLERMRDILLIRLNQNRDENDMNQEEWRFGGIKEHAYFHAALFKDLRTVQRPDLFRQFKLKDFKAAEFE